MSHPQRPKFDDGQEFYGFSSNSQSSSTGNASASYRSGAAGETFGA
jgi:hypothetical protein